MIKLNALVGKLVQEDLEDQGVKVDVVVRLTCTLWDFETGQLCTELRVQILYPAKEERE